MSRKSLIFIAGIVLLIAALSAVAEETQLGSVSFPNSGSALAQPDFLRGVLLLHSFEYDQAKSAFVEAQKKDPSFAMAYWGEAMTYNHPLWMERDRDAAMSALKNLAPTLEERLSKTPTEREKDYLRAVEILYSEGAKKERDIAYSEAMRDLYEKYPDDLDAASFYALSLLGTCQHERQVPVYMKAAAVVEEVFDRNPEHPGAVHYLIHAYDDPVHAPLGLRPARVYAKIAPAAVHALHMPSHIFLALGMWDDVISSNEASWEASKGGSYHALHWLQYGYLQVGRAEDAAKLLAILERDAKQNPSRGKTWYLVAMKAAQIVETDNWQDPAVGINIEHGDLDVWPVATDSYLSGMSAAKSGKINEAQKHLGDMKQAIEKGTAKGSEHQHGRYSNPQDFKTAAILQKQLEATIAQQQGNQEQAIALLKKAAEEEDTLSFEFGPPNIVKPSHELLGEAYLNAGEHRKALEQFELALQRIPGRSLALKGKKAAESKLTS